MIYGFLHQGSGLGNQLHRYVATRVKALELKTDWRMIYNPDNSGKVEGFKGQNFMNFDKYRILYGLPANIKSWTEKRVLEGNLNISPYDPEFNFIEDNTIIEGEFQDERYWQHYEKEVNKWLKVKPLKIRDNLCVIGFRGGEYLGVPDLFLPKEYWLKAIELMKKMNPDMEFIVHTDDAILAQQFFPNYLVIQDIELNWRSMRYAKYAIIANSSFFILPRWFAHACFSTITTAPRYWARHNTQIWALPQNYYSRFIYI